MINDSEPISYFRTGSHIDSGDWDSSMNHSKNEYIYIHYMILEKTINLKLIILYMSN